MFTVTTRKASRFTFATQKIPFVVRFSLKVIIRDDWIKGDGTCALCLQAFVDGRRDVLPLNVYVPPDRWDKTAQKVINHEHQSDLNLLIRAKASQLNEIMLRYRMMERALPREKLREEFLNPTSRHDFYEFFERELQKRKPFMSAATFGIHSTALKKLRAFKPSLRFSDLTKDFLSQFELFLKRKLHKVNTIHKYMKTLKVYVRLAVREKLLTDYPFEGYRLKTEQTDRTYLDERELQRLVSYFRNAYCPAPHQRVLRYFLFSCVTGLRISDVRTVTHENIVGQELVFQPKKNASKIIRLPLEEFARELIMRKPGKLFDTISGQKTNVMLQKIGTRLEIKKHLTFHVARHTFATLMLRKGGAVQVVQNLLGHSKIQTTMVYVHIADEQKREHVRLLDNLIKLKPNAV